MPASLRRSVWGTTSRRAFGCHLGKFVLKSGSWETPCQSISFGVPSRRKILKISSISESPGKSGWPVTISGTIVPIDHISTGHEYCFAPSRISGARYQRVTTSWVYVRRGTVKARARPKSASLRVP